MKKAFGYSLLLAGAACLIFMFGVFVGRITLRSPQTKQIQTAQTEAALQSDTKKININTANEQQLQQLSGIGETLAKRIIEYRDANGPFSSFQELQNVEGLGNKTIIAIIEYICLEDES